MAEKSKKIKNNVTRQWYVRDENGGVFGAVDFKTLKNWVEDGRVSPLSQVSCDEQSSWKPAVKVAELEMNCVAEVEPGSFYGPINCKAMAGLVRDGSVPGCVPIYSRAAFVESASPAAGEIGSANELRQIIEKNAAQESEIKKLEKKVAASDKKLATAKKKAAASKKKIAELGKSADQFENDYQERIAELNEHNLDLKSRLNRLSAEFKEKEAAWELCLDNMALERESSVKKIREESLETKRSLEREISALQSEIKAAAIQFEKRKEETETEQSARSKLIVLKQLFIEAADLLQEMEGEAEPESEKNAASASLESLCEPELLEFEEVGAAESPIEVSFDGKNKRKSAVRSVEETANGMDGAVDTQKMGALRVKKNKRWPFGRAKNNVDRRSLAELEARARIELQRLSSKGGGISALFDKNK